MRDRDKGRERRSHPRIPVEGVTGSFLLSTDACVLNLSIDGMAIETRSPLKVGRAYQLKLREEGRSIPVTGKVVWCALVKTQASESGDVLPVYHAGLQFMDVLKGLAADIQGFIQHNSVVSLQKRLFGRFRLDRGRSTNVDCEAEFRILQISLAGMLIETDLAPPLDSQHRMEVRLAGLSFETDTRIVHSERIELPEAGGHALHCVGVEFLDLPDEARQQLQEFIDSDEG